MSKMKAVVLEKSDSHYTVLGVDGSFRKVRGSFKAEIGEEVEIQLKEGALFRGLPLWVGIAATFLLVFMALLGWNLYQTPTAIAMLSVDINPSVQFTVDAQDHLLKIDTQNEDAKRMLNGIDLKGKPIEEAVKQIVTQACNQKFLNSENPWVVVGYSALTEKNLAQTPKQINESQITAWVKQTAEEKGFTPQVAVFTLTPQEREKAQKGNLSLGEYGLWETAQKAGIVTESEGLRDTSEQARLLENPKVQAQINAEQKGQEADTSPKSGTVQRDTSLTHKPSNQDKVNPPVPIKGLNVRGEKSKGEQDAEETKNKQKSMKNNQGNKNGKEHNELQRKEPDQAHDTSYFPVSGQLPTEWNNKYEGFRTYRIPEFMGKRSSWEKENEK